MKSETTTTLDVMVLAGSASDLPQLERMRQMLSKLGLSYRVHLSSAHRTPERTVELIRTAEEEGAEIFICAAGMAAHLAGAVAAHTLRPVLGVPLPGGVLDGVDALLSTVQMPSGIPVATFAVGKAGAVNAAVFAAQVLASKRPEIREKLRDLRAEAARKLEADDVQTSESYG